MAEVLVFTCSDFCYLAGRKVASRREDLRELVEHFNVSFVLYCELTLCDTVLCYFHLFKSKGTIVPLGTGNTSWLGL